jgi:molybdopterin converting factor small subunit
MKVELKLFASFRRYLPSNTEGSSITTEIRVGTRVSDLLEMFEVPSDDRSILLVNGVHSDVHRVLKNGDVIAVFPAIAGG